MVDENEITKAISSQAGYLTSLQGRLLHLAVFTALNHFFVLIMHLLSQTQAGSSMSELSRRHMIMVEMQFLEVLQVFPKRMNNRFMVRDVSFNTHRRIMGTLFNT